MKRKLQNTIQQVQRKRRIYVFALTLPILLLLGIALAWGLHLARPAQASPWMDDAWGYRTKYPITNSSGSTQTDFQTMLTVDTATLVTAGKMLSTCNDVRVTDINGKSLPVWVEPTTCNTASTKIWTKVPTISTSGADIYFYYGNPTAPSVSSTNGTFIREANNAAAAWPMDDTTATQSYSRVVNPAVATGREIIVNGGFVDTSVWTTGAGWSISGGAAHASAAAANLSQVSTLVAGKAYTITFTISNYVSGSVRANPGGGATAETTRSANGTYTETVIAVGNATMFIQPIAPFTGDIDNVSVKQLNIPDNAVTPTQILTDGNMETAGVASWTAINSATLSKQVTSPHSGSQVIRVTRNGVNNPAARQTPLTAGITYRAYGYMRSDGSATPQIINNSTLVNGSTSTAWQPFDVVFVSSNTEFYLQCSSTGTQYCEFDDVVVSLDTGIRSDDILSTLDGNMEVSGTAYWTNVTGSPTLSKSATSPHGGTQVLRATATTTSATQFKPTPDVIVVGKTYRVTGYARTITTGTAVPRLLFGGSPVLWTGSHSSDSSWQFFDIKTVAAAADIRFDMNSHAVSDWVEWDDISVTEIDPLVGTPTNGVTLGSSTGASGHLTNAYTFDGTNDNVNIYTSDVNSIFNQDEGTAIVWAKVSGAGVWTDATSRYLALFRVDANNKVELFKTTTNNQLTIRYVANGTTSGVNVTTSTTGWFQTAITWSKPKDQVLVYLNGAQQGSTVTGLGTWTGFLSSTSTVIGAGASSGSTPWSGMINDVRLYTRALSPAEISDQYNASSDVQAYTTSTYLGKELLRKYNTSVTLGAAASEEKGGAPIAYWAFDEGNGTTTKDQTRNNNTGTLTNMAAPSTATSGWQTEDKCISGKCLAFDGSDDYVDVGNVGAYTSDFTISTWINSTTSVVTESSIIEKRNAQTAGWALGINANNVTPSKAIWRTFNGGSQFNVVGNASIAQNTWYYLTVVQTNGSVSLYVNGLLDKTGSITNPAADTTSTRIGYLNGGAVRFTGRIDEPKIFNYARTAAQIKADYDARKTNEGSSLQLAPNQKSLSDGLIAHYKMDESTWTNNCSTGTVTDSSGIGHTGLACPASTGPTTPSVGKFSNGANFDGTDDYIDAGDLGITSGTISMWVRPTDFTDRRLFSQGSGATTQAGVARFNGASSLEVWDGGAWQRVSTYTFTSGIWYHLTFTYARGTASFYLNGVFQGSTTANLDFNGVHLGIGQPYVGMYGNSFQGGMDEFRVYSRALSGPDIKSLYNYAPGPLVRYKLDEGTGTSTVSDSSGNGFSATMNGGILSSGWVLGKYGKALSFDGVNDYISTSNVTGLGKNDFTIDGWIYVRSQPGFYSSTLASFGNGFLLYLDQGGSGNLDVDAQIYNGTSWNHVTACNTNGVFNTWYHIGLVYKESTTTGTLYFNGVACSRDIVVSGGMNDSYTTTMLNADYSGYFHDGLLDDIRVYNYARTDQQVVEDMQGGRSDSTLAGSILPAPLAYYKFNEGTGTVANNSGFGGSTYVGTLTNMSSPATGTSGWTSIGKQSKALLFDGSDDYVSLATKPLSDTSTDFSISAWVKIGSGSSASIFGQYYAPSDHTSHYLYLNAGTPTYDEFAPSSGQLVATRTVNDSQWHHVVVTRSGPNRAIYIDGKLNISDSNAETYSGTATTTTLIGRRALSSGFSNAFNGMIDEVKIYNSGLTAEQVLQDYNSGSSLTLGSVNSATESATLIDGAGSSPVAYWNFDEKTGTTANDTSGTANTGTWNGTLGNQWAFGKFGGAGKFNGSNNYVSLTNTTVANLNAYTIEGWFKTTATTSFRIYSEARSSSTTPHVSLTLNRSAPGDLQIEHRSDDSTFLNIGASSTLALNDGRWHFASVVRSASNSFTLYVDGRFIASSTVAPGTTTVDTATIGAGRSTTTTAYADGLIDDVRLYNYPRTQAQIAYDYNRGGPVGWWKMNECQGTTVNDSSGNNNIGTLTVGGTGTQTSPGTCNSASSAQAWSNGATGKYNASLSFDGTDDSVSIPNSASIQLAGGDNTISAWIKPTTITSCNTIFDKGTSSATREYGLFLSCSGANNVFVAMGGAGGVSITTSTNFIAGSWQHIVLTRKASVLSVYRNGVLVGTGVPVGFTTNTAALSIGANTSTGGSSYNGQIDDIKLYNYALSAQQILTLYNNSESVFFGPLTGSP